MVGYLPATTQHQPLLYDESCTESSNEDDDYYNSRTNNELNSTRHRFYLHRRARRFTRFIVISIAVVILLLLIYVPIYNSVQSRLVPIPGWSYNTSRNVSDYVLPNERTVLLQPRNLCHKNFFLLIVVCSSVENFSMRQTIRETWGNVTDFNYLNFSKMHEHLDGQYLKIKQENLKLFSDYLDISTNTTSFKNNSSSQEYNFPVRVVFLIGVSSKKSLNFNETVARLKLESEQYDDIIQENFLDTYNNLTIKSVMMLKWIISSQCLTHGKFLMKCDDDTFVNVPNILHILLGGTIPIYNSTIEYYDANNINVMSPSNRLILHQNLLIGYLFCTVKPIADPSSKWYSPVYMYNGDIYPNYLSGSSYLMSFDVIPKLFNASINTLLLHLEDVYLTGICAQKIHLKRKHHPLFSFNHKQDKCSYKGTVSQHYLKGDLMRDVYSFVVNNTIHCPPPDKYFKVKKLRKRLKSCL